jgi:hypothetical protein
MKNRTPRSGCKSPSLAAVSLSLLLLGACAQEWPPPPPVPGQPLTYAQKHYQYLQQQQQMRDYRFR